MGGLFAVQHGRDQLRKFWKDLYTPEQSAELPSEEFHLVEEGTNAGWPYTYWDGGRGARMIAPEYGGDGLTEAPAGVYQSPLVALPAHWGPNAIAFYTAEAFPGRYRDGAFVALHDGFAADETLRRDIMGHARRRLGPSVGTGGDGVRRWRPPALSGQPSTLRAHGHARRGVLRARVLPPGPDPGRARRRRRRRT